jgi:type II secretory pathway pseudopilin PulG
MINFIQPPSRLTTARRPSGRIGLPGMTLLEMTVVILVLMLLITVLFFGAQAWKRGSDRALCIIHIQNVQRGVRSYANLYGLSEGMNAPNLQSQVIGLGRFVEATPVCPGSGVYSFGETYGNETIPPTGELYMQCTLSASQAHVPDSYSSW